MVTLQDLKYLIQELIRKEITSGNVDISELTNEILKSIRDNTSSLTNLDVALSTRASESTLSAIKTNIDNIDIPLSTRASEITLSAIKTNTDNLDVLLSTRASESTLSAIKAKTDNLDVLLSTRASEATLSAIKSKTDRLTFSANNRLEVNLAETGIITPIEKQSNYKEAFTIFSGTVTTNGNTGDVDVERFSALELELKVTTVSGTTPSLNVYIEGKFDTTGDYKVLVYQENITSTGIWFFTISQLIFKTIRIRWTVSGTTPSFTFRVDGVGVA